MFLYIWTNKLIRMRIGTFVLKICVLSRVDRVVFTDWNFRKVQSQTGETWLCVTLAPFSVWFLYCKDKIRRHSKSWQKGKVRFTLSMVVDSMVIIAMSAFDLPQQAFSPWILPHVLEKDTESCLRTINVILNHNVATFFKFKMEKADGKDKLPITPPASFDIESQTSSAKKNWHRQEANSI